MEKVSVEKEVATLLKGEEAEKQRAEKARKSLDEERERLRLRVKNGATTGNRIRDFVLVAHRTLDTELIARYQALEKRLVGQNGQLFLVIIRREESNVKYVMAPRGGGFGGTHVVERRVVGRLSGEELVFEYEPPCVMLPAEATIEIDFWNISEPKKEPFAPQSFFHPFDLISERRVHGELECELIIGDDDVLAYLRTVKGLLAAEHRNLYITLFRKAARVLGKTLPESCEEKEFREFAEKRLVDKLRAVWHEWHSTKDEKENKRLRDELGKLLDQALADEYLKSNEFVQVVKNDWNRIHHSF